MQIHSLTPIHKRQSGKRIGRGGKKGTTSGKGTKGQSARSGSKKIRPAIYDLIKKFPKLRGWKRKARFQKPAIVNILKINKIFKEGDLVSKKSLISTGLVKKIKGEYPSIKILGKTKIDKKLVFEGLNISAGAKKTILKAGGEIRR